MAVADPATVFLPIASMRDRELLHEGPQFAVTLRPEDHVPMIGHERVRENPHRASFERLGDDPLEGFEIGVSQKQLHPSHAPIQDVKDHSPRCNPRCS